MRNLFLGFVLGLLVATGAGVWAQSSQTLGYDLEMMKHGVAVCVDNVDFRLRMKHKGDSYYRNQPDMTRAQAVKLCTDQALAQYKERVQVEENLIEGMTKYCCPNIKQPPNNAPRYQEPKGYRNVEAEKMLRQFEAGLQAAR